jgi:CRISPR type I-F-associated protein Csy2
MESFYLKLSMTVYDANVVSNFHITGLPSLTSVDGFSHAIERNLNASYDEELFADGFSYIIEDINYQKGKKKYSIATFEQKKDIGKNSPIFDHRIAKIKQTIIIKIHSKKTLSSFNSMILSDLKNKIFNKLFFSGGNIFFNHIECFSKIDEAIKSIKNRSSLLIEDSTFLLDNDELKLENEKKFDMFLRLISKKTKISNNIFPNNNKEVYLGNIIPIAIGYYKLTNSEKKLNSRDNKCDHFYAESVMGLARTRSLYSVLKNINDDNYNDIMWINSKLNEKNNFNNNLYIVSKK